MTANELRAFEKDVAEQFNVGKIRAPVHLAGGNEEALLDIFQYVQPDDWVCGAWRMHYHCLLKGVPPHRLKADILAGRSITLTYPEYRVLSSAIVGGVVPIGLGIAWANRSARQNNTVWCFMGDMTALTGIVSECMRYAENFGLQMKFVVENNGLSVATPTVNAWGATYSPEVKGGALEYHYKLPWPHAGAGKRVEF